MLPTTDSKTISDSQISTIEITTKQEQSTNNFITQIESTKNEITTTVTTRENIYTESTDHFTYSTTEISDSSPNVITATTSASFNSTSTRLKSNATSTYTSSTKTEAFTTAKKDDSFETVFLTALFSSVGAIIGTTLIIGLSFYCKSKKFSVIHPAVDKNEFIELK